jgi:hypothetical protein
MMVHAYNPALRRLRQDDGEFFEANPSYIASSRPA